MDITRSILDKRIIEFEDCISDTMTYREWIREQEEFYELTPRDLDNMTDEELKKYDDFLFELTLK